MNFLLGLIKYSESESDFYPFFRSLRSFFFFFCKATLFIICQNNYNKNNEDFQL